MKVLPNQALTTIEKSKNIQPAHGWEHCELGEFIQSIEAGKSFKCDERPPSKSEIGVVKISAVTWGEYSEKESKTCLNPNLVNDKLFINNGDFLFSRANTIELVGACVIARNVTKTIMLSDKVLRIQFKYLAPRYALYFLRSQQGRAQIEARSTGNQESMRNIGQQRIKSIQVPVPGLREQHRIVARIETLFSELDKGIESLKTAREQLKVYRQAVLKHAFEGKLTAQWREENQKKLETPEQLQARIVQKRKAHYRGQLLSWEAAVKVWEENDKKGKKPGKPSQHKDLAPITDDEIKILPVLPYSWRYTRLAEISRIGSGVSVSKDRKLSDPVTVAYLRVANVQRGELILDEIKKMAIEKHALPALALEKWDILFNEGGDRDKLGRGWVWEKQLEPCITQNHVFRASPYFASEFHSKFISHWGNTFGKDYFEKGGKQTTNLASINKTVLSMFPVPLPSLEEQEVVIRALDDSMSLIDAMDSEVESSLARSEILRQSILKKAFSGQLVPQDPNDEPASALLARIQAEREAEQATPKAPPKRKAKTSNKAAS